MRYKLPIDRSVNRLVPHYLSGRRFILFVQSCLYPLQSLNERFRTFARERHIEARMTSQVIYFEWFLNYRFGKYIKDGKDRIFIKDSTSVGVDLYHEGAEYQRPFTVCRTIYFSNFAFQIKKNDRVWKLPDRIK